jgi:VWFA-related protein
MAFLRGLLCETLLLSVFSAPGTFAQEQPPPSDPSTIRVTSRLVFLDVTVLDSSGHPVVKGLTKDDFTITDDKKPRRIFSFEAPQDHVADDHSAARAPVTIFVLDLLNSSFEDFAYIRYKVRKYLEKQPAQLNSPAELMVLGNRSLKRVQGYTRNKADLLYALDHVPASLPYKRMNSSFIEERFVGSIDALQQLALQSKGMPGRKNIVWVGHGGPNIEMRYLSSPDIDVLNGYVHDTTNLLVDARMSLFVIYPGLQVGGALIGTLSEADATADTGDDDPFSGEINFGVFVNETGGNLFYNRNDVDREIERSEELGSQYYTLTYQPPASEENGKFRRVRVSLRDPNLRVVTKTGYFSPDKKMSVGPRQQTLVNLSEAARSTIPFESLGLTIEGVVRHPDTGTAEFTVLLASRNIDWQSEEDGKSSVELLVAAASLTERREFLASRMEAFKASANNQDPTRLSNAVTRLPLTIKIPRKTRSVRVVIQTANTGRIGAVELDRKIIDAAPEAPTPMPQLIHHLQAQPTP